MKAIHIMAEVLRTKPGGGWRMERSVVVLPTADGKGAADVGDAPATGTNVHGVSAVSVLDVYATTGVDGNITPCATVLTSSTTGGETAGRVATGSGPRGKSPGGEPFGHGTTKYRHGCLFVSRTQPRHKPKQ